MRYAALLGRLCYSAIFIMAAPGHFSRHAIEHAASQGVPMASVLVPLSGIIALVGGLSVLFGYKARYGAWLLVFFLAPVTITMHRFWGLPDPMAAQRQHVMFMKNLSMLGAALLIAHGGSGPLSVDDRTK